MIEIDSKKGADQRLFLITKIIRQSKKLK